MKQMILVVDDSGLNLRLAKEILELREKYVANGGNEDDFELL